jgi:hypothetical protein
VGVLALGEALRGDAAAAAAGANRGPRLLPALLLPPVLRGLLLLLLVLLLPLPLLLLLPHLAWFLVHGVTGVLATSLLAVLPVAAALAAAAAVGSVAALFSTAISESALSSSSIAMASAAVPAALDRACCGVVGADCVTATGCVAAAG